MINQTLKNKCLLGLSIIFLFTAYSCSTPITEVTYLNGIKTNTTYPNGPLPDTYVIRPTDQLFIQVISDDPVNVAFLNITSSQSITSGASSSNGMELITYLVDENGKIEYPYLGPIEVGGLTVSEISRKIQKEVDKFLQSASVFVKQVNRSITVLGEVRSPGQIVMVKNQLTIFEAVGAAGDITDYGNRKNVKVIRESPSGKQVIELNLTDPNIILSPYFYVLPHDIVIVEHSTKIYGAKNMSYGTPISIALSVISTFLLTLNLFM